MDAKIASLEAFPLDYPVAGRFKFFTAPPGKPPCRPTVVVKATADDGSVGWGQCVPSPRWSYETPQTVLSTIRDHLAPELIGLSVFDIDEAWQRMNRAIAPSFSTGQPICKAGIDLALFDLSGKLLRQTAAERWNRRGRTQIELSWTVNVTSLDEVEPAMGQARERGYRHFNVKVAPDPRFDVELCRLVRRLAPDGFVWADANGGYDEPAAREVAPQLANLGFAALEQPLAANRLSGYQRLVRQGAIPIVMDEGIVSAVELEEFIGLGLLNGVAMKVARCGGLTESRRVVELLLNAGLLFMASGLTDPDLSLAASLLLFGAYGLEYPAALNGPQFLAASILKRPLEAVEGRMDVPDGPGLGVEVMETLEFGERS